MKNLASVINCDSDIVRELLSAGINIVPVEKTRSEVPYTFVGEKNGWRFTRAWYYWVATPILPNRGMPLSQAIKLFAITKEARVGGDCTAPHPEKHISWFDLDGNEIVIDPTNYQRKEFDRFNLPKEGLRFVTSIDQNTLFCNEGKPVVPAIKTYHIDSQTALNAFVQFI